MRILFLVSLLFPFIEAASLLRPAWSWGQRIPSSKEASPKAKETLSKPFLPFFQLGAPAGPLRPDGTFKGRTTKDTLPSSPKDTYTTLDKLQKRSSKRGRKGPIKKVRGGLGGLDPDEVFYADEDLIIIKGGGFRRGPYDEPPQHIESEGLFIPFNPEEGEGGTSSLAEEYNGNIPSILPPPSPTPAAASHFSPLSLFLPSSFFPESQSINHNTYARPPSNRVPQRCFYLLVHTPPRRQQFYRPALQILMMPIAQRLPPTPNHNSHTTQVGHSLLGDINVNYVNPKPVINEDAEIVSLPNTRRSTNDQHKKHTEPITHKTNKVNRPKL